MAELVERNLRYLIREVPVMPAPRRGTGLPEPYAVYGSGVELDAEPSEDLPGYALVSGPRILEGQELPDAAPDTPVLVLTSDGGCYEAFLLEDGGIGLYLPEEVRPVGIAYAPA